jgi:hypothetical protein
VFIEVGLVRVVTVEAQALQFAGEELIPVTPMMLDVIGNGSGLYYTPLEAHGAQRLLAELMTTDVSPALALIPTSPWAIRPKDRTARCHLSPTSVR